MRQRVREYLKRVDLPQSGSTVKVAAPLCGPFRATFALNEHKGVFEHTSIVPTSGEVVDWDGQR
jgi:hypothetical protein